MTDTKKPERQRRCLHCSLLGPQSSMRLVQGAGWLHEPIEGCMQATSAADTRSRHQRERSNPWQTPANARPPLDDDEDAFKLAERD